MKAEDVAKTSEVKEIAFSSSSVLEVAKETKRMIATDKMKV